MRNRQFLTLTLLIASFLFIVSCASVPETGPNSNNWQAWLRSGLLNQAEIQAIYDGGTLNLWSQLDPTLINRGHPKDVSVDEDGWLVFGSINASQSKDPRESATAFAKLIPELNWKYEFVKFCQFKSINYVKFEYDKVSALRLNRTKKMFKELHQDKYPKLMEKITDPKWDQQKKRKFSLEAEPESEVEVKGVTELGKIGIDGEEFFLGTKIIGPGKIHVDKWRYEVYCRFSGDKSGTWVMVPYYFPEFSTKLRKQIPLRLRSDLLRHKGADDKTWLRFVTINAGEDPAMIR